MGKVLANVFPVMAPQLALSPTPTARWCGWNASPTRWGSRHGPADILAADPAAARRLAAVAGASSFATDLLATDPTRLAALSDTLASAGRDRRARRPGRRRRARRRRASSLPHQTGDALTAVAERVVREALAAAEPDLAARGDRDGQVRRAVS